MTDLAEVSTYFTLLPQHYYTSQDILDREVELVFRRQWQYAGHISQIRQPGDFFTLDMLGESVIVVRGADDSVNALLNVCRHRGYPVCTEARGSVKRFVCGYHKWAYHLNGQLAKAPTLIDGTDIDYQDWGLRSVKVELWHGFIFICLGDPLVASVATEMDALGIDLARLEPERMKMIKELYYEVECNWKVLLENAVECYHCQPVHAELCATMDMQYEFRPREESSNAEFVSGGIKTKSGMISLTMDGKAVCTKFLGKFGRGVPVPDGFAEGFGIRPTYTQAFFSADHGSIHTIRPLGVDRAAWTIHFFVNEEAVEGEDYEVDKVIELMDVTLRQDFDMVPKVFKGVKSRGFVPGPLSPSREPQLKAASGKYRELMGIGPANQA